jgi:hypothetical protein
MKEKEIYIDETNFSNYSRDELLAQCLDLNLPVSRFDSIEVLRNHLEAAYDEIGEKPNTDIDPELKEECVYIGKRDPIFKFMLTKFIQLF